MVFYMFLMLLMIFYMFLIVSICSWWFFNILDVLDVLYIYVIYVSCFEHECVWNLLYIVFGCNIYINSCMSNKLYKQHLK